MRSLRYLNTVLTVITILLTAHLWMLWTLPTPPGPHAAMLDLAEPAHAAGLPNSGMQRKQTNDLLKRLIQKTEELSGLFKSGRARVQLKHTGGTQSDKPSNG